MASYLSSERQLAQTAHLQNARPPLMWPSTQLVQPVAAHHLMQLSCVYHAPYGSHPAYHISQCISTYASKQFSKSKAHRAVPSLAAARNSLPLRMAWSSVFSLTFQQQASLSTVHTVLKQYTLHRGFRTHLPCLPLDPGLQVLPSALHWQLRYVRKSKELMA